ncbi:MAG: transposase [Candidatus Paceibacterota bacterium]
MDLYHVLNRGVEKRDIFMDNGDRVRFVHELYEFNDTRPANNTSRKMNDLVGRSFERERLVDIHGWCLMKNHYHLLLSERMEGGLTKFLMKLNVGYAKFFNEKYKRSGYLFSGRTKKVLIENDAQFNYILHYIHLNPLDYLKGAEEWRIRSKGKIKNSKEPLAYLKSYRWSSYLDYIGEENFPSLLTTSLFGNTSGGYEKTIAKYLKDAEHTEPESSTLNLE